MKSLINGVALMVWLALCCLVATCVVVLLLHLIAGTSLAVQPLDDHNGVHDWFEWAPQNVWDWLAVLMVSVCLWAIFRRIIRWASDDPGFADFKKWSRDA